MTHTTAYVREDRSLELPIDLRRLVTPGQTVELDLDTPLTGAEPNEPALETLRVIQELTSTMTETTPSHTDRLLREGRDGGMYGA